MKQRVVFSICVVGVLLVSASLGDAVRSCPAAESLGATERSVAQGRLPAISSATLPPPTVTVGGCLLLREGWWSYEFCPSKWIRQFHEEQSTIVSEYFLGLGKHYLTRDAVGMQPLKYSDKVQSLREKLSSEAEASVADGFPPPRCRKPPVSSGVEAYDPPQVVVDYVGGTMCDVNQERRRATVVYVCSFDMGNKVAFNVTETKPCRYTLFVVGQIACEMMGTTQFKPSQQNKAQQPQQQASQKQRQHGTVPLRRRSAVELADMSTEEPAPSSDSELQQKSSLGNQPPQDNSGAPGVRTVDDDETTIALGEVEKSLNFEDTMIFSV